jgi:hypothetical protein
MVEIGERLNMPSSTVPEFWSRVVSVAWASGERSRTTGSCHGPCLRSRTCAELGITPKGGIGPGRHTRPTGEVERVDHHPG